MVITLDRLTKSLVVSYLSDGSTIELLPGIVDFLLVYNRGAAWGMFEGARLFFVIGALIAVIAILLYVGYTKRHATLTIVSLGLLAGGAIGNAIDRALSGEVVDFIHLLFIEFPLFNVADSAITCGVILMFIAVFFGGRTKAASNSCRGVHCTPGEVNAYESEQSSSDLTDQEENDAAL
jgi:signal peptidase II